MIEKGFSKNKSRTEVQGRENIIENLYYKRLKLLKNKMKSKYLKKLAHEF
jgi:hypothetical protein